VARADLAVVQDLGHPRKRYCLALGRDPDRHDHVTLTTFELVKSLIVDLLKP